MSDFISITKQYRRLKLNCISIYYQKKTKKKRMHLKARQFFLTLNKKKIDFSKISEPQLKSRLHELFLRFYFCVK